MKAFFIPLDGGKPLEIKKDVTLIGRRRFCDITFDHPSISKVHLVVVKTDGVLFFRDLASTNGTKVNGQRACRGALLPNDKLSIAACKFTVKLSGNGSDDVQKTELISEYPLPPPPAAVSDNQPASPVRKVIRPDHKPDAGCLSKRTVDDCKRADAMVNTQREPPASSRRDDCLPAIPCEESWIDDSGSDIASLLKGT